MSDHSDNDLRDIDDAQWNESAASSTDPAQRQHIKTFCSVTGADADSALHVLEAHNWDMDRSVMFFMEGGVPAPRQSNAAYPATGPASRQQVTQAPIAIDDDLSALETIARPAEATASAPPSQHEVSSRCTALAEAQQPS